MIHNGVNALTGATAALSSVAASAKVIVVSNSTKRATSTLGPFAPLTNAGLTGLHKVRSIGWVSTLL